MQVYTMYLSHKNYSRRFRTDVSIVDVQLHDSSSEVANVFHIYGNIYKCNADSFATP
jgi:hypothetical protein